jgi:hypothetical protein
LDELKLRERALQYIEVFTRSQLSLNTSYREGGTFRALEKINDIKDNIFN